MAGLVTLADTKERVRPAPGATPSARRLVLVMLMCLVLGGLGGVLAATASRPEPAPARFLPPRESAYDFSLRNEAGRRTSLEDARGKVVALTFVYSTCRDLCPAEGNAIAAAVELVGGRGVVPYMVSVDPVGDTPARVRGWLERRGLDGGKGHFLIGSRAELRPVWQHYGIAPINATRAEATAAAVMADKFRAANKNRPSPSGPRPYVAPPQPAYPPPGSSDAYPDPADLAYRGRARHAAGWDFEHSAYVMLIDKRGVQRVGLPFENLDAASLAHDMSILLAEPV